MKFNTKLIGLLSLFSVLLFAGCTAVNTFPMIARSGDTVSVMVGGSAKVRKENLGVVLTDAGGNVFDLQALGLVRSVFNLRTDGRAVGLHYIGYLSSNRSWLAGHEPLQTVMVTDLPTTAAPGVATLAVTWLGTDDNSSDGGNPFDVSLEIIAGSGVSDQFLRNDALGTRAANLGQLETAPNAKVDFGTGTAVIGAASLVINFDGTAVNPNDLNLYVPESTVRGSYANPGAFGKTQRMVYWHQDGESLYVDIIAPQGIDPHYLQFYIVHPQGLAGSPSFSIVSAQVYGTDGNPVEVTPVLTYSP
jgi:hypothetical protein